MISSKIDYSIHILSQDTDNTGRKIGHVTIGHSIVWGHQLNVVLLQNTHGITGHKIWVGQIQISQDCSDILPGALDGMVYGYLTLAAAKCTCKYSNNTPYLPLLSKLYIVNYNRESAHKTTYFCVKKWLSGLHLACRQVFSIYIGIDVKKRHPITALIAIFNVLAATL